MQEVTKDTEQYIDNKSFDETYQVQQVEIVGYDADNNVLRPIAVTDQGEVKVTL